MGRLRRRRTPRQVFGFRDCAFRGRYSSSAAVASAAAVVSAASLRFLWLRPLRQVRLSESGIVRRSSTTAPSRFRGRSSSAAAAASAAGLRLRRLQLSRLVLAAVTAASAASAVGLPAHPAGLHFPRLNFPRKVFIYGSSDFRGGTLSSATAASSSLTTPADDNRSCGFDAHGTGCIDDFGATDSFTTLCPSL